MMHCILVSCFAELGSSCSSLFQTFAFWKGLSVLFVFVSRWSFKKKPFILNHHVLAASQTLRDFRSKRLSVGRNSQGSQIDADVVASPRCHSSAGSETTSHRCHAEGHLFATWRFLWLFKDHAWSISQIRPNRMFGNRFLKPVGRIDRPRDLQKGGIWRRW